MYGKLNVIRFYFRFSYNVVHFAMCHIYSGISAIPDSVSILELATLTDMLGLEGLKEAIMFTLKVKYCHHFHRVWSLGKQNYLSADKGPITLLIIMYF